MDKIIQDVKLDFNDVLIQPLISNLNSRKEAFLTRHFTFKHSTREVSCVPIIASNMATVSSFTMSDALNGYGIMTALHKHYTVDELINFFTEHETRNAWYSLGTREADKKKFWEFCARLGNVPDKICLDVANGHRASFFEEIRGLREAAPNSIIMAGTVVTPEAAERVIQAGADIVRVGIGGGSGCLTRPKTGVGYPQLSAILDCSEAVYNAGGLLCSDGSCTVPGDIAKAFAAGADFVMLGGMFAGHDECDAVRTVVNGQTMVQFYGESSYQAMHNHHGGMANYRASEGRCVQIPAKGPVCRTVEDIFGGLRSCMTYVGAHDLVELAKKAVFVRLNNKQQYNTVYEKFES